MEGVFAKVFGRPIALEDSLTASQVRGWDSLTNIRLLDAVERDFAISLSVTEAMSLDSVGSLVNVVHEKLSR
jgi:acyl carrier protein